MEREGETAMHEKSPLLKSEPRSQLGSRYCKRLRETGKLPAVVYGRGTEPVSLTLDLIEAAAHIRKGEKVFRLNLPGAKAEGQTVLLKELQWDYLGSALVHCDFARVNLTDRVKAKVPIHLIGEAVGLKQAGAILMHPTNEVEVECVLKDLPDFLEVQINELDVGHAITAGDIKLPTEGGLKLVTDKHSIVAQIVIQQEIVVAEATAATTDAAGPEVITAKKVEGEEGAAAAPGAKPAAGAKAPAAGGKDAKPAAGGDKKK
jgi:large subunit ribosomal protein L25